MIPPQGAPYQEPPGLEAREFVPFEPVLIRGYTSSGGKLAFESEVASETAYAHQLHACQELLERGILARVDVIRNGTTELLGSLIPKDQDPNYIENRLKRKLAEMGLGR